MRALALLVLLPACRLVGDETELRRRIEQATVRYADQLVAVAYRELGSGRGLELHADEVMHAASTMKVPVMIELFRQADAGELDLDAPIAVRNEFASIVDGSPYVLTVEDDSDAELYERVGGTATVRELIERMIQRSSNLATNILIELAGADRVQRTIEALGTTAMRVRRGVEDPLAYRQGLNNVTTARDLLVVMRAIADGTAASAHSCGAMIEILAGQHFGDMIPAGLPAGARVAHKTGSITRIHHDAAIVLPDGGPGYVLVVMTRGFDDQELSAKVGARVARIVHSRRLR